MHGDDSQFRETDSFPWTIPPGHFSLLCSVGVRSVVSRVSVGSVALELVGLLLELGIGLWLGLGQCPGGEMFRRNVRHSQFIAVSGRVRFTDI